MAILEQENAEVDAQLSTQPAPDAARRVTGSGLAAQARRWWRQLTSMRTALLLLFLLALAAVPGSTFPQRSLNQLKVDDYFAAHPKLAPILDRLSAFDVFASPWFAAIYLLLFVSLIGCIVPRTRLHARALLRRPPEAPRNFDRLPLSANVPAASLEQVASVLRRRRWRVVVRENTVAAEKGYLRETGNLVFHLALVIVLGGVAIGGLWGWKASVLVVEDGEFCDTVQAYDQFTPGGMIKDNPLPAFCVGLKDFRASYLESGQPGDYAAEVRYSEGIDAATHAPDRPATVQVNSPLRMDGANVYLINHGYAPILKFTDRYGVVFNPTTPFLPQDLALTSEGVVVLPDANLDPKAGPGAKRDQQVAFEGIYMPTLPSTGPAVASAFPAERDPGLILLAYRGDTGLDAGVPRSVYTLDQAQVRSGALKLVGNKLLRPGETWTLDDGSAVTFVGTREWASFQVGHDPGQVFVLVGSVAMVLGLLGSLTVRRRRVWFRIAEDGSATAGGLARTDAGSFESEFRATVAAVAPNPEPPAARD
jgi:cytochrome c biogenesis protein